MGIYHRAHTTSPGFYGESMDKKKLIQNHLKPLNDEVPFAVYAGRVGIRLYILFMLWLVLLGLNSFFGG